MTVAATLVDLDRTRLRLAVLRQWVEAGMAVARRLSEVAGSGVVEAARALLKVSLGVRLALALHARLSNPDNPLFQPRPAKTRAARIAQPETKREPEAEAPDRPRREPVRNALTADEIILRRPLAEIVKVICDALGIVPDWSLWSDDDETPSPPTAPLDAIPEPRPRPIPIPIPIPQRRLPALLLKPPPSPWSLRVRLRSCCAPDALNQALAPIATLASGRLRLAGG